MTITPADIKVLASAAMTDADDGGGFMGGVAVQDGTENNVFPDLSSVDRVFGRLQLRKIYPAVVTTGVDALLGANLIVEDEPDDTNIATWVFAAGGEAEQRSAAIARLQQSHWAAASPSKATAGRWNVAASGLAANTRLQQLGGIAVPPAVGMVLYTQNATDSAIYESPVLVTAVTEILVTDGTFADGFPSSTVGTRVFEITYTGSIHATTNGQVVYGMPSNVSPRLHATAAAVGALSAGATTIAVDSVLVPVVPVSATDIAGDAGTIGIDATNIPLQGRAVGFRGGDAVVVHHSAETSPSTVANGATIDCGRTNITRAVLIDTNGKTLTSGYSVALATGIITVTDITGWAQPVKARHTIEDVVGLQRTGYPETRQTATAGSGVSNAGPFALTAGLTMYCGRPNVGQIKVYSKTGQDITDLTYTVSSGGVEPVVARRFSIDLTAGTVVFSGDAGVFITSHSPVTLVASGSSSPTSAVSTSPQANPNLLTLNRGLGRAFPSGTLVSSALLLGDLQARASVPFSQETWESAWASTRSGPVIVGQYDHAAHPITVTNDGAATDRWALIFTSPTAFRCVSEQRGQVATGDVNTSFAPINAATGRPFFSIAQYGWGAGWNAGNVLRFDTVGASSGVWVARVTLPSAPSTTPDSLTLAVRGDIDA